MEINAVLEKHGLAKSGLWYVLSPENEGPSARVGHACCVLKTSANILKDCPVDNQNSDSLLIIGGANPDGAFDDVYILDFEQYKWCKCEWQGLPKRYEHSAFIPEHASSEIVVFGGAQMDNNLNDVQVLDKGENHLGIVPDSEAVPGTIKEPSMEATLDVSLSTLQASQHDDTGGEHKPDAPSNTDTPTTLVHGGNEATLDVSLSTLQASQHDDTGGEREPGAPSNTDTSTTLVHGGNEATLDVSLSTLQASRHDDTEGEHKPDAPSNTDTPTTLVRGGNEATLDVSLPTITGPHYKEVQTVFDVQGELPPVTDDSNEDNKLSTILVHGDAKKTLDIPHHDEVEIVLVSDGGEIKSSESSGVEVWNDGCPLPSSGPTCSEWQNTDAAHSSGAEAISTRVSTAGCLPECEEPRSGCVNIESVMSSEQVSHAPSTSIIEDGTKIVGNEGFQNKVEDAKSWCLSLPSGEAPSRRTCHSAAAVDNRLFIFGGGQSGAEPVQDDKLYVYSAKENQWSQPDVNGVRPKVRHGHVMIAVKNGIYLHGGMAGTENFGDLWKLTIDDGDMNWLQPTVTGDIPSKRAAHAGCAVDETLYLFGGMNETGALDDLYSLNTESMLWQKIQCEGPPPHCRLDHTMSAVTVSRNVDENEETTVKQTFVVVFGGMDTSGQIFDDCLAFLVKE